MKKSNKFDSLNKEDLLRLCLEQEDELEKWRPKPAKFKLGQLVAFAGPNPQQRGQPAIYFSILSVEYKMNEWLYGYSRTSLQTFATFPERKCRALTQTELDGTAVETVPSDAAAPMVFPVPSTLAALGDF